MPSGRTIEKGWVVPPALGIALIMLILSSAGAMYWRMDAKINARDEQIVQQNFMLVEIKTRLEERTATQNKENAEIKESLNLQKVYFDSLNNQIYTIKGMLGPKERTRISSQ